MLDTKDNAKLVDFGVCLVLDGGNDLVTETQGSPLFFSPEMCEGGEFYAKKCDIWAAGVTLWKMLFDQFPFQSNNQETLFNLIRTTEPNYPEFIDEDLRLLLQGLFKKNPEERITLTEVQEHSWMKKGVRQRPRKKDKQGTLFRL